MQPRQSILRRFGRLLAFRLLPLLLVVALLWSVYQVVAVFTQRYNTYQQVEARQGDYSGTATAMARTIVPANAPGSRSDAGIRLAQFITNTPAADSAGAESGGLIATNTPSAEATPIPPTFPAPSGPVALPTILFLPEPDVAQIAGTAVPTRVPTIPRDYDLVNILLMGDDGEITNDGTRRTDTMIVVSINLETNSVAMLSLPRDLFVYIPTPSMQRLNTIYGIGENLGWSGGAFFFMRQVILHNFGINVHYHALVNIGDLTQVIDTLGGVQIAVDCPYRDFALVGAEVPQDAILSDPEALEYTLPVGYYDMSGAEAMWYARTRQVTDDFDRGRRQQRLLLSILRAARANGQLQQLPDLWNQLTGIVQTDMPFDVMLRLLPIAAEIDLAEIETFTLIRTYHTQPWTPSQGAYAGQNVQLPVYEPLRQLLTDFYQPPTQSQLALAQPSIAVFNGTTNADWDRVAAETLLGEGFNAYAAGAAEQMNYAQSRLIDQVGEEKSSPVGALRQALNIPAANVEIAPDANRSADYRVVIGADYDSCPVYLAN